MKVTCENPYGAYDYILGKDCGWVLAHHPKAYALNNFVHKHASGAIHGWQEYTALRLL